ncbi:MAG: DUF5050 domain-containing protein [Coprobacillus sp.]
MICPRCKQEMKEDAVFCPHCGLKLDKCPACHQPIIPGSRFCSYCGTELNPYHQESHSTGYYQPLQETPYQNVENDEPQTSFNDIEVNKKVNKKVIIISVVILIALTAAGYGYLKFGPKFSFKDNPKQDTPTLDIQEMKIGSTTSFSSYTGNMNQNGEAYFDGKNLYVIDDTGSIVKMDTDLSNRVTLLKTKSKYLTVVENKLYYTDDKDRLCSMTTDGKDQTVIIDKKVFYPIIKDNKVYYQLDEDNESIHIYDLTTNKDTKVNDRKSYNINVTEDKIYYTSEDGIYVIGIDGKGEEKLVSDSYKDIGNIIYQNKKIYYYSRNQILAYNVETKEIETIIEKDAYYKFHMNDQYLFFYTISGSLRSYDFNTKKQEVILNATVQSLFVVGDKLIITTTNRAQSTSYKAIVDFTGENQQRLFSNDNGSFV